MNDLIRELASQAGAVQAKHITNTVGDIVLVGEEEIEKFAGLIVQACIQQAALIGVTNYDNSDISWAAEKIIKGINERFGVKQ